ncbi:MAG TPA: sensor histidine kinase [Propionibacteriaceae bacterium]|nr:sensor histidine kinase [Propionibacteriaceae bacterium]
MHSWERWVPAWHGVFFGMLALAMALALADPATTWTERTAISGLGLLLGGWYWLWVVRRRIWTLPILQVLAYFAGAAALWLLLASMNEAFFLIAFSAYQQVFSYLPSPRSAIPGVVVLTGLLLATQSLDAGRPSPLSLLIALLAVGLCILASLWVDAIMRQSQDRHRLIEELEATRAELATAERQAGTLGERQRLAQEIHDTLAQGLTSVVTLLEATEAELDPGQAAARRHLAHALRTARDTLAEVRRFVWALQPQALDQGSLAEALGRLAETLADETGMTARFLVTGAPQPLPAQAEIALLRAAQEGTANIRKHARASEAVLTLSYLDDRVILDVRDDGRGFDAAADGLRGDVTGGLGLRGLKARLAMLGGSLEVESAPAEGTVLVAQVPIGAPWPDTLDGGNT